MEYYRSSFQGRMILLWQWECLTETQTSTCKHQALYVKSVSLGGSRFVTRLYLQFTFTLILFYFKGSIIAESIHLKEAHCLKGANAFLESNMKYNPF